ncbi:MAG: cadherin-like beta sandwich domain-containing protein [Peptococcia bacterium]
MTAANLAELTITPGALSPAFKASNLNYTVILEDRAVNSVNITATPAADDAMVTIDGLGIGTGPQSINVDVSSGTKEVPVVVTEADGITTKTYKIRIIKVGYLTDLALNGASLPGFAPETLDYTINVANATDAVDIAAILEDPTTQDLMINNQPYTSGTSMPIPLNEGQNTISIKVTVPGYETIYTLNIYRASLVDLKALTTNLGTLKPEFVPGTSVYTITLDDAQALNEIEITATPFEDNATVTIGATSGSGVQTGTVALNPGTNAINIVVANGTLEKTYTVNVIRPAYLTALTVKNNVGQSLALTPGFASTTYDYTLANVANSVEFLDITAVGEGAVEIKSNGVLCDASHVPLNVWENTITIEVIVSGATRTYKLAVYREPSKNANLANLTTSSGTWDPVFDPATTIYAVTLDEKIDSLTLTAATEHPQATVKINGVATENANIPLTPGINTATVTVTAEDGITTKNYTVDIRRPAYLEALTVKNSAGQTIALTPDFTSTTFNYTVDTVPNNVIVLAVTATGEESAIIDVNGSVVASGTAKNVALDVGATFINIEVTEPETEIIKTYTLKVYRAADVNLSNLSTNTGKWNEEFTSGTTSYTVTLEKGDSNITITAVPADDQASVKIGGQGTGTGTQTISVSLDVGINSIPIEITGRDGATKNLYSLTVIRPVTLSGLTISNGTLDPAFDKDTLNYTARVDDRITSLEVTASAADGAKIYINDEETDKQAIPLNIGTNNIFIRVEMSGTSNTYKLTVTRSASDVNLDELRTNIGTWDKTFTRETTSYTVTLDKAVDNIDVTVTPADLWGNS